jgi:hypothetical protein
VSARDPLTSRCPALAKSTGRQCRQWVRGGGVCRTHGGAAFQVKAAREARIITMEAELEAAKNAQPYERRDPGEVLMDAVMASDVLLQHLLRKRAVGELTPEESVALEFAIDRATRTSKTALDANVSERLVELQEQRIEWNAADRAGQLNGLLVTTLRAAPLSAADKLLVWRGVFATVREILQQEVEVPRMRGPEVQAFTAELEREAAAEVSPVALGIGGDDEDSDDDDDSGLADVPYLFPAVVDAR